MSGSDLFARKPCGGGVPAAARRERESWSAAKIARSDLGRRTERGWCAAAEAGPHRDPPDWENLP
jgi:hypothetical protein